MVDWQHELRNQLNLVLYLSNWARDAAQQGRRDEVMKGLEQIDGAIIECGHLLARSTSIPNDPATPSMPDQR